MKKPSVYPLLLSALLAVAAGSPATVAQETGAEATVACDDKDTRDRSRSGRRRAGGSNRDCEYKEVTVDAETGEVLRETAVVTQRSVLPRRYSNLARPTAEQFVEAIAIPDRWRIVDSLGQTERWYDPYNQNTYKGDKPIHDDWFFSILAVSDTVVELREVPTPVGGQSSNRAGAVDIFGGSEQSLINENIILEFVYLKGDTVFRPPDWEYRFTPVINYNVTQLDEILGVNADPADGKTRYESHVGVQALFVDKHLRNVSDQFDFDSIRVGIQPFSSDFRGFLYQDAPFGIRLFGNRENNQFQYNLAWFRRLEKDINSGLNDVTEDLRDDDIFVANLYWQDQPTLGFFSQATIIHNRNREDETFYDENRFIARPASLGLEIARDYDVTYLGYNGDGHFGRLNLTTSFYVALGEEKGSVFTGEDSDIEAYFFAIEPGIDLDWIRLRASFLYGSGDDDPFDDKSEGFAAILENPQFAGADTSYWIRQGVPLIGGGRVALSQRNAVLPSLLSSKEHGQSNFTSPGIFLLGAGVDFDITPEFRLSFNVNYLEFAETEVLKVARNQGNVDEEIGLDVSAAAIWRPFMSQNVVLRLSYAQLLSGDGYHDLFEDEDPYSLLFNLILTY